MKVTKELLEQLILEEMELEEGYLDRLRAAYAQGGAQRKAALKNLGRLGKAEMDDVGPIPAAQAGRTAATKKLGQIASQKIKKHVSKLTNANFKAKQALEEDLKELGLMQTPESRKEVNTILVAMDKATKRLEAEMGKIALDLSRLGQFQADSGEAALKRYFQRYDDEHNKKKKKAAAAE